ncbi:L-histidine N(alpha)-methyltransferase [Alteromonas pelagimontana]|uniref:L-histidine N(Alpha)-methyltransferase n=1 Tax=Alteromonas pelagimontana TaxID=1858656 RepID=A0A6M4M9W3_9ALTE|nr:L-histidine N(alpha)-methyltransferase [Alteromonas pelagimontana]QJR79953.1 L-histidine N(alpha)-methyltransferase [Alteromonas pelagimontana]
MEPQIITDLPAVEFYDFEPDTGDLRSEVIAGLSSSPKYLPPKYFYDQRGSELFDQICELPEYYVTRTELGLLQRHGEEMAALAGKDAVLMELGSGSSMKIRTLLAALQPQAYVAMDISKDHLLGAATQLAEDFGWLEVHAVCVDYSQPWEFPYQKQGRRTAFFPGSSLGNFEPGAAKTLLSQIGDLVGRGGGLLIGIDLQKDVTVLEAAYNDAQGVTEAFNKNLLMRLNAELKANFDIDNFTHKALWNPAQNRIEMHLFSQIQQTIQIDGHKFNLAPGESIHTENSYKYTLKQFQTLASSAGFETLKVWTDDDDLFSVHYLQFR